MICALYGLARTKNRLFEFLIFSSVTLPLSLACASVPPEPAGKPGLPPSEIATGFPEHVPLKELRAKWKSIHEKQLTNTKGEKLFVAVFNELALEGVQDKGAAGRRIDKKAAPYHKQKTKELVGQIEEEFSVESDRVHSTLIEGFSIYLNDKAENQLSRDKRIKALVPAYLTSQSGPTWVDSSYSYGEVFPWGVQSFSGPLPRYDVAPVHVLDSGVDYNNDLNVISRTSVGGYANVGCYQHATFIAGIIGAYSYNYTGVVGLRPNTPISSVAFYDSTVSGLCSSSGSTPALLAGLEAVRAQVKQRCVQGDCRPGILNMSFSGSDTADVVFNNAIQSLTSSQPWDYYPGTLAVHAAGNNQTTASGVTLPSSASDGYIRVGGHDQNGQPVVSLNAQSGFWNASANFTSTTSGGGEPGSNFGANVDVWAPAKLIKSTVYGSSVGTGSGTSFAAPHIAALAASVRELSPQWSTAGQLEQSLRLRFFSNGAKDSQNYPIYVSRGNNQTYIAKPTVEFFSGSLGVPPGTSPSAAAITRTVNTAQPFTISADAVGGKTCNLGATWNGYYWFSWSSFQLPTTWNTGLNGSTSGMVWQYPGTGVWTLTCWDPATPNNTNTATATVTVTQAAPSPSITWYVDGQNKTNQPPTVVNRVPGASLGTFTLQFYAANTSSCSVNGYYGGYFSWGYDLVYENLWYQNAVVSSTGNNWGLVGLYPNKYSWVATCIGLNGQTVSAHAHVTVQ